MGGAGRPKAIVVSLDGFAAFYRRDPAVRIPTLRSLAARGAVAAGVEPVFPSTTWPTPVTLVTGVRPEAHGVVGNHVLNRATGAVEVLRQRRAGRGGDGGAVLSRHARSARPPRG